MEERKKEILQEIHNHVDSALTLLLSEFDIREKDSIERKTGVQLENSLIYAQNSLLKVLGNYELPTYRDIEEIERMHELNEPVEKIEESELRIEKAIVHRKNMQLNNQL